jgi:hypothetical protein
MLDALTFPVRPPADEFFERLAEADDAFARAFIDTVERLKTRFRKRPKSKPRADDLAGARRAWIADIPSFGSLVGPTPVFVGNTLTITETRAVVGLFRLAGWHRPPAETGEPRAVAVARVSLTVRPRPPLECPTALLLLIDGAAIDRWFDEGQEEMSLFTRLRMMLLKNGDAPLVIRDLR